MSLGAGTGTTDPGQFNVPNNGAPKGGPVVRKFPFAYNTPNILTGATVYTPTVGDILLDAWVEIDVAWNGTTPLVDFGTFVTNHYGWFAQVVGALDLTRADGDINGTPADGLLIGQNTRTLALQNAVLAAQADLVLNATPPTQTGLNFASGAPNIGGGVAFGKFSAANPIKVVVSQTGANNGANPVSTKGSATLYLITATPL